MLKPAVVLFGPASINIRLFEICLPSSDTSKAIILRNDAYIDATIYKIFSSGEKASPFDQYIICHY